MATKKPAKKRNRGSYNGGSVTYADVHLQVADKDAFLTWSAGDVPSFEEALNLALSESYRVTFKHDYQNSCVQCTWTQQDEDHHNADLVIISRSDNCEEAFMLNVYKVYSMFDGERLPSQDDVSGWG